MFLPAACQCSPCLRPRRKRDAHLGRSASSPLIETEHVHAPCHAALRWQNPPAVTLSNMPTHLQCACAVTRMLFPMFLTCFATACRPPTLPRPGQAGPGGRAAEGAGQVPQGTRGAGGGGAGGGGKEGERRLLGLCQRRAVKQHSHMASGVGRPRAVLIRSLGVALDAEGGV